MLLRIVRKSLLQHAVSTGVTALSLALGVGLVMAVFQVTTQSERAFRGGELGFDAVLGARGNPIQLVLNAVFHLETSPGNLDWEVYRELEQDPRVEVAVPYVVGDSFHGFRIVGTTPALFEELEYHRGRPLVLKEPGAWFDPWRMEAVIGSRVAEEAGLRRGAHFNPTHGFVEREDHADEHEEEYVVVGELEPTNSPVDRVIWIPIEGALRMDGHVLRGSGERFVPAEGELIPEEHKEISAALLKLRGGFATGAQLDEKINREGKRATLAYPIASAMGQLFSKLGWMTAVMRLVAYLVVVVAAASVLASIYNTMNERRREFAILRALGAGRRVVFGVIVLEAGAVSALGSAMGFGVYALILSAVAALVRRETGVVLEVMSLHPALLWTPLATIVLGALTGVAPAWKAYRTDVARGLVPQT